MFTLDIFSDVNYPWNTRHPADLMIPVPEDVTGDDYLRALESGLDQVDGAGFDVVFYQAGVDPLEDDRLGRLRLNRSDLQARNALVYSWCESFGKPVVVTMGGGYSKPIERSIEAHVDVFCQAARILGA